MSPEAEANSRHRFDEIVASMRDLRYLTPEQASALAYPTNAKPHDGRARLAALSKPVGLVVNQVLSELTQGSQSPFRGMKWSAIVDGGYGIYTTIDPRAQSALEHAADGKVSGSAMYGQPAELQAAAVLVEPGTGRVLGYYGGDEGTGRDYAGIYADERGDWTGFGAHPPGDTFMVHTLAAALKVGYSLNSYWSWPPHDMPGRQGTAQLRNTSTCPLDKDRSGACSLLDSTTASLNVPYYTVTVSVTPAKVLEMARDAGVNYMWSDSRERVDLTKQTAMTAVTPSKFDTTVGIGQYPVTVIDQANAMATYGAGGLRASAHFVYHVMDGDHIVYGETLPAPDQPRVLNSAAIADLDYALSQSPAGKLTGRVSASKTGSWEYNNSDKQTAHAWMVGYTSKLAMAVWIGNRTVEQPLRDARQSTIWGSGLPSTIYRDVMNSVHDSMSTPDADFPVPAIGGNVNPPGSVPR
jgi:membrane peptidoglycan carboxypeptidase